MKPVTVTRPFLPPLEEYVEELRGIWERAWLTNQGPCHDQFEKALAEYLGVQHVSLACNGTIALQLGLRALRITGEVITTPYSFPATTHALHWSNCTPVFCDVDPDTGNLDPSKVQSLITPKTTAILPVHVYGTPCDVAALQRVADAYGLKLIYDAAHAFGVRVGETSVLTFGDLAILSFHATKVFTTAEGGALVTHDPMLEKRVGYLKNFGFEDEVTIVTPGTNGKMNEFQAALGIVQLRYVDGAIAQRREISALYRERLTGIDGIQLLPEIEKVTSNFAYMPIFVDKTYPLSRDELYDSLRSRGYFGRRYFYPLISEFAMYRDLPSAADLPVATKMSRGVICLPIYAGLGVHDVEQICEIIRSTID